MNILNGLQYPFLHTVFLLTLFTIPFISLKSHTLLYMYCLRDNFDVIETAKKKQDPR